MRHAGKLFLLLASMIMQSTITYVATVFTFQVLDYFFFLMDLSIAEQIYKC